MDIFTLIINIIPSKVNSILLKRSNFAGSVSPIRGLLLLLFLFLISGLQGQLNIKIGYGGAYTKAQQTNNIISSYNQKMDGQLNQEVRAMHWLHGIDMGARYRRGNTAPIRGPGSARRRGRRPARARTNESPISIPTACAGSAADRR